MSAPRTHTHTLRLPVIMPSKEYCSSCVEKMRAAVTAIPGVELVEADRRTSTLTVVHDPAVLSEDSVEAEVARLGLVIGEGVAHASWRVIGLD